MVSTPVEMGFRNATFARPGQVPIFRIPHNEIEDVFGFRQDEDGGVPDLGSDVDELVDAGDRLDPQHGALRAAGLCVHAQEQGDAPKDH